jgi:hypothetical protein
MENCSTYGLIEIYKKQRLAKVVARDVHGALKVFGETP